MQRNTLSSTWTLFPNVAKEKSLNSVTCLLLTLCSYSKISVYFPNNNFSLKVCLCQGFLLRPFSSISMFCKGSRRVISSALGLKRNG